jgi:WD40 repeat protein
VVVTGNAAGHVDEWSLPAGRRTAVLALGSTVRSVALSPGGTAVAAGGDGGQLRVWDTASHRLVASLAAGGAVTSVALGSRILAAAGTQGEVSLWNPGTGELLASVPEGSSGTALSVALSPDGQVLAVGGASPGVALVRLSLARLTAPAAQRLICGAVRAGLTRAAWAAAAPGQPYQRACPGYAARIP